MENPPEPRPALTKNLGHPLSLIITTFGVFIISQALAFIVVSGVLSSISAPHADLNKSITAQFFFILIAEGLAGGLAIWITFKRGLSLAFIGLGRRPRLKDAQYAVIGFVAFYVLLIAVEAVINSLSPDIDNQKQNLGFNNISNGTENLLTFISLVILPPLGEETLVRGYLFSGLRRFWRFWPAALVTSLVFAIPHLEIGSGAALVWAAGIDTFLLSIVLCYLRQRTGALYAGMLVHMLNNLVAFLVVFK
jgi:membrane protease YdiL (CAAX protease family)